MSSKKVVIARITKCGKHFEILVDSEKAFEYRMGQKRWPIHEMLAADAVYRDAKKGLRASSEELKAAFGTDDVYSVAKTILDEGQLQLTVEQRRRMIEEKKRQIIALLSKYCVDPRTKLPHPPTRIERAMEEAHVSVDPFTPAEEQLQSVIEQLRPVLPIVYHIVKARFEVPPQFVAQVYGVLKKSGNVVDESWRPDGTLVMTIEVPSGTYPALLDRLGKIAKGAIRVREV